MNAKPPTYDSIPDYFDITIYDVCGSWGMSEWIRELSSRRYMDCVFEKAKKNELTDEFLDKYLEFANRRISMPLKHQNAYPELCLSPIVDQLASDFFEGYFAVRNPRYRNWVARMHCAEDCADEMAMNEECVIEPKREIFNEYHTTPAWKVHRDAGYTNSDERFFIGVDLRAPDDYLVDQFKSWINKTREEAGIKSVKRLFGDKDLNQWHRNRYLPFLDIYFWLLVNRKKINFYEIEAELFPNRDPGDRVRKTILKNAVKLVSGDFIFALRVQQREYSCVNKFSENSPWMKRLKIAGF